MVTEYTRRMVWEKLIESKWLSIYFGLLSDRGLRWHNGIRFMLFLFVVGSVGDFVKLLHENADIISAVLASIVMAFDFIFDNGKKSATLHSISAECGNLHDEWEELWSSVNYQTTDDDGARRRYGELNLRLAAATNAAGHAGVTRSRRLIRRSANEANRVIGDRYAEQSRGTT